MQTLLLKTKGTEDDIAAVVAVLVIVCVQGLSFLGTEYEWIFSEKIISNSAFLTPA